ncbi:MAG: phage portal protein [Thermodesulfobacteriota bacterium]
MSPTQWIQRAFPEAPLMISKISKDGKEKVENHPLIELINNPNPFYSGISLWWASIFSWVSTGDVYWLIEKNVAGKPVKLWWAMPWLIRPKFPRDGSEFLTGYEYRVGGEWKPLELDDVCHIKHGIDPSNPRLGISPIYSCLREIWNDDEASNFVASLLRNSGVPGLIISPDSDEPVEPDDVDTVKQYFKEMFTGDKRGEPVVLSGRTKVDQFGFDPKKLDLSNVRNVTEERICAALGIPAAVVGFGTGLEQTTVGATLKELRQLAWVNGIMPVQRIFAEEIERSLLPMFESNPEQFKVEFDLSNVAALDEDTDKKYTRVNIAITGGWMSIAEGRGIVGLDVEPKHEIFLRPASSFETPDKGVILYNGKVVKLKALKEPSPDEARVIDNAPRRRPIRSHARLIRTLQELERKQAEAFAKKLTKVFRDLGEIVARVAEERLKGADIETKDPQTDAELIASLVDFGPVREALREEYADQFDTVARSTFGEANTALGLAVNLPDPVAVRIAQTGGRRLGLIDLSKQVRDSLFTTIAEAREQGLGVDAMARLIRQDIPKGPWSSVEIRARVIARTETKFAQNQSMIEYSKTSGAQYAMVFDNRTGFDDEECSALDGVIVTLAEAESLMDSEHVNGTRSFTPWYEEVEATG